MPLKSSPIRKTRMKRVNRKRRQSEFARAYGSKKRVEWVKAQPCVACGGGPSENAHVASGGKGRKADASQIVPLCRPCHARLHQVGVGSFEWEARVNLAALARLTDADWQEGGGG